MKRILSLLLVLAISLSLAPAALGAEAALPMTCEEYEEQYRILNPTYSGLGEDWETMYKAYQVYLVNAYSSAHPGELEALGTEELLALLGYSGLESYMALWPAQASTREEAHQRLLYTYVFKRNAVERVGVEAAAYRAGYPQLWADLDANAYFEEEYGTAWSKADYEKDLLIFTEEEFRENMFVRYIALQFLAGGGGLMAQPAAPAAPSAPSWVAEEGYLTFPGDPVYQPGNWGYVLSRREEAEKGGLLPYEGREWAEGSVGQCYETALVRLRMAENYTDDFEARAAFLAAGRAFSAAERGRYEQNRGRDETYYRLSVEKYRAYLIYHVDYISDWGRALVPALDVLDMSLEEFFDAPNMDRVSQADRDLVAEEVAAYQEGYDREKNRITVELDGVSLAMDTAPQVADQRVMVPIRAIAEALGADVGWDEETWEVTLTRAGTVVALTPGETAATVDGKRVEMDVAPYADSNRTYVPARYVAEFFGQSVTWDGENRRVVISEDKSAWEDSNLEAWLLPMGSLLGFVNGGDPARFGLYARPPYAEAVLSPNGVSENRTVAPRDLCREILAEVWEIEDREALLGAVEEILKTGDQKDFQAAADEVRGLTGGQIASRTERLSDVDKYMWPWTKALDKKWGGTGIRAWDLCRAAALAQWGYTAGYATYNEVMELLEPAAEELAEKFDSWDEVCENFLEGYYWCLRQDLGDGTVWDTELGMAWQYLKNSPDTRTLFNDDIFENGKE